METEIYFYNPHIGIQSKNEVQLKERYFPRFGLENWIDQTFFIFKENFSNKRFHLVDEVPDKGVIIFHSGYFLKNFVPNEDQLLICIAADYGRNRFAQVHIFQNQIQTQFSFKNKRLVLDQFFPFCENLFIPHWSQPGIMERNNNNSQLRKIGYFGRRENFDSDLSSHLNHFCKENQLNFTMVEDWMKWNNYEDFDLILAIRDLEGKVYSQKPFSKIVNALIAGVPVIGGNESSSVYFKKHYFPGLPIVSSKEELFSTILEIRANYQTHLNQIAPVTFMLRNTYESDLQTRWVKLFDDAQLSLKKWKTSSAMTKSVFFRSRVL